MAFRMAAGTGFMTTLPETNGAGSIPVPCGRLNTIRDCRPFRGVPRSASLYGLPSGLGHFLCEGLAADFPEAADAGGAVGAEYEAEQSADPVVELAAGFGVGVAGAGRAGVALFVQAAFPDGAPRRLGVVGATGAAAAPEGAALAAIQPALLSQLVLSLSLMHSNINSARTSTSPLMVPAIYRSWTSMLSGGFRLSVQPFSRASRRKNSRCVRPFP